MQIEYKSIPVEGWWTKCDDRRTAHAGGAPTKPFAFGVGPDGERVPVSGEAAAQMWAKCGAGGAPKCETCAVLVEALEAHRAAFKARSPRMMAEADKLSEATLRALAQTHTPATRDEQASE